MTQTNGVEMQCSSACRRAKPYPCRSRSSSTDEFQKIESSFAFSQRDPRFFLNSSYRSACVTVVIPFRRACLTLACLRLTFVVSQFSSSSSTRNPSQIMTFRHLNAKSSPAYGKVANVCSSSSVDGFDRMGDVVTTMVNTSCSGGMGDKARFCESVIACPFGVDETGRGTCNTDDASGRRKNLTTTTRSFSCAPINGDTRLLQSHNTSPVFITNA
mmetsp:Transcript_4089/g.7552  ORF Transcript_4089/g.7552 Transcript_4089/m.7552 type:complete len:215 (-) Transcript_4089:446-1090(-)